MRIALDLAWAAGFFDGEGWVGAIKKTHAKNRTAGVGLSISIAQTDPEVLEKFAKVAGFGNLRGPYNPKTANSNPYWVWRSEQREEIRDLFKELRPYLSSVKCQQFERALVIVDEYRAGAHDRHVAAGKVAAGVRWDRVDTRCE